MVVDLGNYDGTDGRPGIRRAEGVGRLRHEVFPAVACDVPAEGNTVLRALEGKSMHVSRQVAKSVR